MSIFQERMREKSAAEQAAGRQARLRRRRLDVKWCCMFIGTRLRQLVGACQLAAFLACKQPLNLGTDRPS